VQDLEWVTFDQTYDAQNSCVFRKRCDLDRNYVRIGSMLTGFHQVVSRNSGNGALCLNLEFGTKYVTVERNESFKKANEMLLTAR
jgi:hypothetical protein